MTNSSRLRSVGIKTVLDFYQSPIWKLRIAFEGITGLYWHTRLHGFEIDNFKSVRKTYGNSYAPPINKAHLKLEIISKLCQKTGFRLRRDGFMAEGIHLSILFRNGMFWHKGVKTKRQIFENNAIYKEVITLFKLCPIDELPRIIAINVFNLVKLKNLQLEFFNDMIKKTNLTTVVDEINSKWGLYTIYPARMTRDTTIVQDRISFGQL